MREFTPEGLGSFFLCQIKTSSFLRVTKQKVMWNERGEKKKKAVSNSGFVNTPKLVILSKLFNMEDALFPLFCKWGLLGGCENKTTLYKF